MIRFGVVLSVVLIAIGLLVTGVVAGSLLLVVISIGVAMLAFVVLIGVVISYRHEIFGRAPLDAAGPQRSLTAPAGLGAMARGTAQAEPAMAASRLGAEQAARPGAEQAARPGAEQAARPPRVSPVDRRGQDRARRPQDDSRDRSRGKQPPAEPVPEPASAEVADRRQQAASARTKPQPAQLAKPQSKAEQTAERERLAPSGPLARQDESAERERPAQEKGRPEPAAAGPPGGGRGTGDIEGSNRNRLAAQHEAERLDRPSSEQGAERDHAEPRRPSRLERESARAAGSRPAAPDAPALGMPADAPEKPDVFTSAAVGTAASGATAGAAVSRATAKPAAAATPADAGPKPGEAEAAVSEIAAQPAQAQAGPVVEGPADADLPSTDLAMTEQASTKQAVGTEPDAPASESQADTGEAAGSQATQGSTPATDGKDDGPDQDSPAAGDDEMQVSVVPGITRYHKSDCLLIRFLSADDLEVMTRKAATEGGCVPCKACKPDQVASDATSG